MKAGLLLGLLVASAALGCSSEDNQQRVARQAVERWAETSPQAARYAGDAYCTDSARVAWFERQFTGVYLCTVTRTDGDCDWARVTFAEGKIRVALERERGGCVLPA